MGKGEKQEKHVNAQKRKKSREQIIPKEEPRAENRNDQEKKGSGKVCSSSVLFIIPFSFSPAAQSCTPYCEPALLGDLLYLPLVDRGGPGRGRPGRPLEVGENRLDKGIYTSN